MIIELNLDTREKQAFFLAMTNHPMKLVEYVHEIVHKVDVGSHPLFDNELQKIDEEGLIDIQHELFDSCSWHKLYDEFHK